MRWQYRVHEQILPALHRAGAAVRWTNVVIEHPGCRDPAAKRRKTERNLALLHRDDADHPGEPFILFNLGWSYLEVGRPAAALPFLRRSLERSAPGASIVPKLYALLAQAHRLLRQPAAALGACRAGLARWPGDADLLLLHGTLLQEQGDGRGAEACWLRLLRDPPGADAARAPESGHFASVSSGLHGFGTRHRLALLYRAQGRTEEADAQWQAVRAERPDLAPQPAPG